MKQHTLICIVGPTAVGKTDLAIELAQRLQTEIISCDSRQFYQDMVIGTAKPSKEQLALVPHHFIGQLPIDQYYSVFEYEMDATALLSKLFQQHAQVVLVGGSGLYLDALLYGMDEIPDLDPNIREELIERFNTEGIEGLRFELKRLDPVYYRNTDIRNPKRILRGLEVCLSTGKPFSDFRIRRSNHRDFVPQIICLDRDRSLLHKRINIRVDAMMEQGLEDEARSLHHLKGLNALKTVGYRELFEYFENKVDRATAVELIKRNTRHYARRQISWNKRYANALWLNLDDQGDKIPSIIHHIHQAEAGEP